MTCRRIFGLGEKAFSLDVAEVQREEIYAESVRRYQEGRRRASRAEWCAFHLQQAERIEKTVAALAAQHRAQAHALIDGDGADRGEGNR